MKSFVGVYRWPKGQNKGMAKRSEQYGWTSWTIESMCWMPVIFLGFNCVQLYWLVMASCTAGPLLSVVLSSSFACCKTGTLLHG
jgi:hypothetical protein